MVGPAPPSWAIDTDAVDVFEPHPGVFTLRLPLAWEGFGHVNAYLLARDDGGATLVDCGSAGHPSCWKGLVDAIERTGHDVTDIRELVITHAHYDHFGLARQVVDTTGCTLLMHPAHQAFTDASNDPDRIREARRRRAILEGVPVDALPIFEDVREETEGFQAPLPAFTPLRHGMAFATAHGPWIVLETPGHAPNHLVFHQKNTNIVLSGDLISREFAPWFDYGYTPDPVAEYQASLNCIRALDAAVALPGHGRPIHDPTRVAAEHDAALLRRLASVESAVREQPATGYALCAAVFPPPTNDSWRVWQLTEILAYLRHLRLTDRINRHENGDTHIHRATTDE